MTAAIISSPSAPISAEESSSVRAPTNSALRIAEPRVTVCRPIIVLGDVARSWNPAHMALGSESELPFQFVRDGDDVRWRLSSDDWKLTSPTLPIAGGALVASSEAVVDVYVGLLAAFAEAEMPADNKVCFSPAAFVRRLGWGVGSARRTPTGGHYTQLELALDYLRQSSIESKAVCTRLEAIRGVRLLRANFSVLQSWSKTAVVPGVGNTVRIEARFSEHFADLLRHDQQVARYCVRQYAELPRGVTRTLFRYIEGLRAAADSPLVKIPARTVLTHIGSRRRDMEPSRMKAILQEPHHVLYAAGVFGEEPHWGKSCDGEPELTYTLEGAPNLRELLEDTAISFGVAARLAQEWACESPLRLAEVLAAGIQGILTPKKSVRRMVFSYMEHSDPIDAAALPHFEQGRGITRPVSRCPEFEFLKEQHRETRGWLDERPDVEKALVRQLRSKDRADWVNYGLTLLVARRMRRAENVKAWSRRVGLALRPRRSQ